MNFMSNYPYLCGSTLLFMIFSLIFILMRQFRSLMLISGIASTLYSLTAVIFVPHYWQPVKIIKSVVGLEDLLFSFANGGIVLIIAFWPVRNKMKVRYTLNSLIKKYHLCTLVGVILCHLFWKAGASVMSCFLYSMAIVGIALLASNRRLWALSLRGAIGFTSMYIAVTAILSYWFPHFYTQWTLQNLWGYRFLSFPLEEYIWAFGYGAVFPLVMAFSLGYTLKEERSKSVLAPFPRRIEE